MKNYIVVLLCLIMSSCVGQEKSTIYFKVEKDVQCGILGNSGKGEKIVLISDPLKCSYDPNIFRSYKEKDIIAMIGELLSYEGDTNKCALLVTGYSPLKSQIYQGDQKSYTVQMEALFMINQVYLSDPFKFSSHPIIYNSKTNKYILGNSDIEMKRIYELYKQWYKKIQRLGLDKSRSENILPLQGSIYSWY